MTDERETHPEDDATPEALRNALADRFHGVDWEALHQRIMRDAVPGPVSRLAPTPLSAVAGWSRRGIPAAAALLAAGVAGLLLLPAERARPAAEPGYWPVAEELLSQVPEGTLRLLEAGVSTEGMLTALMSDDLQEANSW
jgi:anti-sigma factor RsiW